MNYQPLTQKQILLRWCGWFFLGNIVLFWLVGLNYFRAISLFDAYPLYFKIKVLIVIFAVLTFLAQLTLLAAIPGFLVFAIAYIFPKRKFIFSLAIGVAVIALIALVLDVVIYDVFRFHLSRYVIDFALFSWRQGQASFDLSNVEIELCVLIPIGILLLEMLLAYGLWRARTKLFSGLGKFVAMLMGFGFFCSYLMISVNRDNVVSRLSLDIARAFPFYTDEFALLLSSKNSKFGVEHLGDNFPTQFQQSNKTLKYPLHELQFVHQNQNLNLVVIAIDAWRYDALDETVMPYLSRFAAQSWSFRNHFSGGDATGPGIFSLFYGVPSSYWTSMELQQRSPVLLKELLQRQYRAGVFSSSNLIAPALNRTVFRGVSGLNAGQQIGKTSYERDQAVTNKFIQFIKNSPQPFFSFLFYDSAHGFCALNNNFLPFEPAIKNCDRTRFISKTDPRPYLNRYKNALVLVDQEIKQVIEALKGNHLLENTVVVITGDHGEEFDDNHLGYWHHASNFTRFQVQTPLIIYWPDEKPQIISHQTSHYDVAPTLVKRLLGCKNLASDYSVGKDLLDASLRPYLIAGSYLDLGIVEKNRITIINSNGDFQVQNANGKPLVEEKIDVALLQNVFKDMRRFYKN